MPYKFEKNKLIKTKTAPGLQLGGGEIDHSDYDTEDWNTLLKDYTLMLNNDPIISTTIDALTFPVLNAKKDIMPGDPDDKQSVDCAEFVNWTFDNLHKGFHYYLRHKIMAIAFGISIHEIVYERNYIYKATSGSSYNATRFLQMSPVLPETIIEFYYDENTFEAKELIHRKKLVDGNIKDISVPVQKLDIFTYNEEFNDIRGKSILRPIRFTWDNKRKLLQAKVIASIRGAGIPHLKSDNSSKTVQAYLDTVGKSLCQGQNTYLKSGMDVELHLLTPQSQEDVIPLLEFLNRELFFNTMTQAFTSGIGQNGSRASTQEHTNSYEMFARHIVNELTEHLQNLSDKIVDNSQFAQLLPEKRPIFTFESITQADLNKVAAQIETLYSSSAITKFVEDENYIRKMFGMPLIDEDELRKKEEEKKQIAENIQKGQDKNNDEKDDDKKDNDQSGPVDDNEKNDEKIKNTKLSNHLPAEKYILLAKNKLDEIQIETSELILLALNKVLDDVVKQLQKDRKITELKFKKEFQEEMIKQFNKTFGYGKSDIINELKSIGIYDIISVEKPENFSKVTRPVDRLYYDLKYAIEEKLSNYGDKEFDVEKFIEPFRDGFKRNRNNIAMAVDAGYLISRALFNAKNKKNVAKWQYSGILDNNQCTSCSPLHNLIFSTDEIEVSVELSFSSGTTNIDCLGLLGGNSCRCVFIPVEKKEQ